MTASATELSEDEFDDRFPLLANHINPSAAWSDSAGKGRLFETHGPELEFVARQDPRTVWTLVDGDDGSLHLLSGFRLVNRIGYLVTAVPVTDDSSHHVRLESVVHSGED